jgi:hypothetical protein
VLVFLLGSEFFGTAGAGASAGTGEKNQLKNFFCGGSAGTGADLLFLICLCCGAGAMFC